MAQSPEEAADDKCTESPTTNNSPSRAICFESPKIDSTTREELLTEIEAAIENVTVIPENNCAILSFLDEATAMGVFERAAAVGAAIGDPAIKVSWANAPPLADRTREAVAKGASRSLFFGNLETTDHDLRAVCDTFGEVETLRVFPLKRTAFVNFTSIAAAVKAKEALSASDSKFPNVRVHYAKDPCTLSRKARQAASSHTGAGPQTNHMHSPSQTMNGHSLDSLVHRGVGAEGNSRSVFLGNVDPSTEYHEIFSTIGTGAVESIKIMPSQRHAFINFLEPASAGQYVLAASQQPLIIHGNQVRVLWAKSAPISADLQRAVMHGTSRSLFLGQVSPTVSEQALRELCSSFGELDSISVHAKRRSAFINFASITAAVRALAELPHHALLQGCNFNFAKDPSSRNSKHSSPMSSPMYAPTFGPPSHPFNHTGIPHSYSRGDPAALPMPVAMLPPPLVGGYSELMPPPMYGTDHMHTPTMYHGGDYEGDRMGHPPLYPSEPMPTMAMHGGQVFTSPALHSAPSMPAMERHMLPPAYPSPAHGHDGRTVFHPAEQLQNMNYLQTLGMMAQLAPPSAHYLPAQQLAPRPYTEIGGMSMFK